MKRIALWFYEGLGWFVALIAEIITGVYVMEFSPDSLLGPIIVAWAVLKVILWLTYEEALYHMLRNKNTRER